MLKNYPFTLSDELIALAKQQFQLDPYGLHAFAHWQRVYNNGMYLCDNEYVDRQVVSLFAFSHDCCRENEYIAQNMDIELPSFYYHFR